MRTVPYPTPGEILLEEFLKPLAISQSRLAKEIGVPPRKIGEIIVGKHDITAEIDLRMSCYFGLSEGFWTGLQDDYNRAVAKEKLHYALLQIKPIQQQQDFALPIQEF